MKMFKLVAAALAASLFAGPAIAKCSNSGSGFNQFKQRMAAEAKASGIGGKGVNALMGTKYNAAVIKYDRRVNRSLRSGNTNFARFYAKKTKGLSGPTKSRLRRNAKLLNSIERNYGVPKEILVTIWGMETAFGNYMGRDDIITSLASLTHDCRRSGFFKPHLLAALKILDRGYMPRSKMRGARHGEIGQVQFLPANYLRYGVDYDGNGRIDLVRSRADALASVANFLRRKGWQAGGGYGPGTRNFAVLKEWNASDAYRRSIAKFAGTL